MLSNAAWAAGEVYGKVLEPLGAPAGHARLDWIHQETGEKHEIIADEQGRFLAPGLQAGPYFVLARSSRTSAALKLRFVVEDGRQTMSPVRLLVNWATHVSAALHTRPLRERNYLDAVAGLSEITRGQQGGNVEGYGPYSPRGNSAFNSIGQRAQNNNYLLDGADNNESWFRGALLEPAIEFIESASLASVYIPARIGHFAGGSVQVTTRSGSNQFHGSVFDYFQTSALNARGFFDGADKPGLTGNRFGATLGGPLRRNRWFFFAGAESLRERRGLTVISTVPTPKQKAGYFGATPIFDPATIEQIYESDYLRQPFPQNRIPLSAMSPAGRELMQLYPDPNLPGLANNYRFSPNRISNGDRATLRIDRMLSGRGVLFGRFSYELHNLNSPGALPGIAASDYSQHANFGTTALTAWNGIVSHTVTLAPTLVAEFRAAVTRYDLTGHAADRGLDSGAAIDVPGVSEAGSPVVAPKGFVQLGSAKPFPLAIRTTSYQFEHSVRWMRGRHSWNLGLQVIRRHADGSASEWSSRGVFLFTPDYTSYPGTDRTGHAIASLLLGYPAEVRRDIQLQSYRLRAWEWGGFLEDEFRVLPKLTISAGVRYSLYPPLTEADNRIVNFNFERVAPALDQFAGQAGVNRYGGLGFKKNTVAPRIGFAYDIFGNGLTVLRGGFTMSYDTGAYYSEGRLARNPPYASRLDIYNGSYQLGTRIDEGLPAPDFRELLDADSLNSAQTAIYVIERNTYTPYADQWSLSLQHTLTPDLTLEISGAGSMGIHLFGAYDANQPYPAPDPYPYIRYPYEPLRTRAEYLGYGAGSTYYGGQLRLAGRLRTGLRVDAAYRYAHQIDDASEPASPQLGRPLVPQYIYHTRGVRSASPYDVKHRLQIAAVYETPPGIMGAHRPLRLAFTGWTASAFITFQGGFPFAPEMAVNPLNNGAVQLPDRVASGALPGSERSHLRWFNTGLDPSDPNHAFEFPGAYQYGDAGLGILRGPGLATVDLALSRGFTLSECLHLRLRFEAYNLLNRVNLALPNRILELESAGTINRTATPSRQLQMSAKVEW